MKEKFEKILASISQYPNQLQQVWDEMGEIEIPEEYKGVKNVVFCGMGGSGLGERVVSSMFFDEARVPINLVSGYYLPGYVDENSLVVLSSYSGNTEEISECLTQAIRLKAKIFGITTGGDLLKEMQKINCPYYLFEPKFNPSGQPRMAMGYSIGSFVILLSKLGLIDFGNDDMEKAKQGMKAGFVVKKTEQLASKIKNKVVVLVASEHLIGVSHVFKNHLNESAKNLALLFDLPELNHHLMEGLQFPKTNKDNLYFVFVESEFYNERVQKRYPLTSDVVRKQDIPFSTIKLVSKIKVGQVFELLTFGSLVTYYLTEIYKIDPIKIPWVDYFKKEMGK